MTSRILFFDYSDSTSALQSLDVPQQPVSSRLVCTKCFRFEDSPRTSYLRTILVFGGEMKRLLAKPMYVSLKTCFPAVGRLENVLLRGCDGKFLDSQTTCTRSGKWINLNRDGCSNFSIPKLRENINSRSEAFRTIFLHFRSFCLRNVNNNNAERQTFPEKVAKHVECISGSRMWRIFLWICWQHCSCLRRTFHCHEISRSIIHRKLDYIPMSKTTRDGPVQLEQLDWSSTETDSDKRWFGSIRRMILKLVARLLQVSRTTWLHCGGDKRAQCVKMPSPRVSRWKLLLKASL